MNCLLVLRLAVFPCSQGTNKKDLNDSRLQPAHIKNLQIIFARSATLGPVSVATCLPSQRAPTRANYVCNQYLTVLTSRT